jgi:LacI family transcriptional regulator
MTKNRSTSYDVAKLAGVSRTTVSFVLNGLHDNSIPEATRQKVFDAAKQLNYHPDASGRKLASGKNMMIGLVLIQRTEQVFMDAFLLSVLIGIEQNASQQGFHVLLKHISLNSKEGYSQLITENHVDGIIVSGPLQEDNELLKLHHDGVPIVLLGQMSDTDIPFVDVDAEKSSEEAVAYLISRGHKNIAMITNAKLQYSSAQQRKQGFINALQNAGMPIHENWIREGDFTPESGYSAMKRILQEEERPDAIFIASDVVAMGGIRAIREAGLKIPEDISVIGFDDIPIAQYYDPPLTTIRLPGYNLGWTAGDRLIRLILNEGLDTTGFLLKSELIIRDSTK